MFKAFIFALLFVCQFLEVLARAIPGIDLSGRDYVDQNPAEKVNIRSVLPRDGQKIAPKILIISMVLNSLAPL